MIRRPPRPPRPDTPFPALTLFRSHARRDICALFMPDHHHPAPAKARKSAEDRLIVAEIAVAGQRHPVVEQARDIMFEMRAVGMTRDLRLLPRRQLAIDRKSTRLNSSH